MNRVQPKHAVSPLRGLWAKLLFLITFVACATIFFTSYLTAPSAVSRSKVTLKENWTTWDSLENPAVEKPLPSLNEFGFAPLTVNRQVAATQSSHVDDPSIPSSLAWTPTPTQTPTQTPEPELTQSPIAELATSVDEEEISNQVVFANLPAMNDSDEEIATASFSSSVEPEPTTNLLSSLDVPDLADDYSDFNDFNESETTEGSKAWGSITDEEARAIEAQRNEGYANESEPGSIDTLDTNDFKGLDFDELNPQEPNEIAGQLEVDNGVTFEAHERETSPMFRAADPDQETNSLHANSQQPKLDRPNQKSKRSAGQKSLPVENPGWWVAEIHKPMLQGRQKLFTSLDEVIFTAIKNSPQVQILNTQPRIQELIRNEVAADFDWSTFVDTRWNKQNDPIGSALTQGNVNSGRFEQRDWSYEAGVTKRFTNGGDIRIGQNFGTIENNSNFLDPAEQGSAQLVLDYRQPLLRSAGRGFNTSQIVLADLDFQSISNESRAELQAYLVSVVDAFWDIYLKRALLVQSRRSIYRAEELYRQLRSRNGIDVTNDQLLRAEAAIATRRSSLIKAEYDLVNSQDRLINLTVGPNSSNADTVELMPEPLRLPMGINFDSNQLVQVAIHNRPEIQQAITRIKTGSIQNQIALNQLRPKLDAVISSYVAGLRGNNSISRAFSDQFSVGEPGYAVGFQFEVPIGNRAAKTRVERSQLEAAIFHQEFQQQVGDVVLDVRVAGREIQRLNRENMNNVYALQKASQELSLIRQRQQLNLDDNKTGSLYIEDLLGSQARLTAAENRLVVSQTQQAVALVDLKRATGELFRSADQAYHSTQFDVSESLQLPIPSTQGFGFPGEAIQP